MNVSLVIVIIIFGVLLVISGIAAIDLDDKALGIAYLLAGILLIGVVIAKVAIRLQ